MNGIVGGMLEVDGRHRCVNSALKLTVACSGCVMGVLRHSSSGRLAITSGACEE